jgi:hypothetical protein
VHKGATGLVRFTRSEQLLLLQRFVLPDEVREQIGQGDREVAEVWLTRDQADELRDQAGDLFQEVGLDARDEPTAIGRLLDDLIDKLFTG